VSKLILHIGRHKTGTTAIQQFLVRNPALLKANGYCFPDHGGTGFGHHDLAGALIKKNMQLSGKTEGETLSEIRRLLSRLISGNKLTPIISSEAFQNCDPKLVRAALSAYDVKVVMYLREPVSYLISSYTQKVHATDYIGTIEQYADSVFQSSYKAFIDAWCDAFDSRNVSIKIYSRDELVKQDIVLDFCESVLGIDNQIVSAVYERSSTNKSLTNSLLAFKLWVNRFGSMKASHSRLLYIRLEDLALVDNSGPPGVSDELIRKIETRTRSENNEIARGCLSRPELFAPYERPSIARTTRVGFKNLALVRRNLIALEPRLAHSLPGGPQLVRSYRLDAVRGGLYQRMPLKRDYLPVRYFGYTSDNYTWDLKKDFVVTDNNRPIINMNYPLHGRVKAGLTRFSGTSSDAGGSGFKSVRFCIRCNKSGEWYNFETGAFAGASGNGATSAMLSNTTKRQTDWSCVIPVPVGNYSVGIKSFNNAGKSSPWEFKRFSVFSDIRCPEVVVAIPFGTTVAAGNCKITGTASDKSGSGFRFVRLCIRDRVSKQWYNFNNDSFSGAIGNGAVSATLFNTLQHSTDWSYSVSLPSGEYTLCIKVFNCEGLASAWLHRPFTVVDGTVLHSTPA